jgi:hypothetical protein
MSMTEDRSSDASGTARPGNVDTKLEVIVIPVSDADRATDPDLPDWYARYVVAQQAWTELPK